MKKIKIVHCADIHFDTPFRDVQEKQSKINKEELKEVFNNIINFCIDKSVDIFLLAGDIFDNYTINKETIYFIENSFKKLERTRVFISPGNHDPYSESSFYKLIKWPSNVYVFKGQLEKVYIKEFDINIWGAAFNNTYEKNSLLSGFSYDDDKINIMVLHGEISKSKLGNEYNPITIEEIQNTHMDYIALGHRHNFSGINKIGKTFYSYSGCPQGRGFDELGNKGIVYGYISKGNADLKFVKTSKRNYLEKRIDISNAFGYEEVKTIIINSISEEDRKKNLYKIVLVGEINGDFNIDENLLWEKIKGDFYYCKVKDKTSVKYDIEEISKGFSIKGLFVKKLMNELNEANAEEEEIIKIALKLGIKSLSDWEVRINDY
ncbi:MAG: DNA repair exonuclease [Clostridiales bacterium]|nr:DNA repair exonuclease [Clostridiales bacterium]